MRVFFDVFFRVFLLDLLADILNFFFPDVVDLLDFFDLAFLVGADWP
jgi:hypothetical protein